MKTGNKGFVKGSKGLGYIKSAKPAFGMKKSSMPSSKMRGASK